MFGFIAFLSVWCRECIGICRQCRCVSCRTCGFRGPGTREDAGKHRLPPSDEGTGLPGRPVEARRDELGKSNGVKGNGGLGAARCRGGEEARRGSGADMAHAAPDLVVRRRRLVGRRGVLRCMHGIDCIGAGTVARARGNSMRLFARHADARIAAERQQGHQQVKQQGLEKSAHVIPGYRFEA